MSKAIERARRYKRSDEEELVDSWLASHWLTNMKFWKFKSFDNVIRFLSARVKVIWKTVKFLVNI